MSTPEIQWYPGHIAKAERALAEQLSRVDVVLDVRDARIPLTTRHPSLDKWVGEKNRVLILNRVDMITPEAKAAWETWFKEHGETPHFANAQHGQGISAVTKAAQVAGASMNQRRLDRGMKPRPVRAVVIGFPNVGKSALINRLLKRKAVASARRAGVTRQLRWVRISGDLDLLDAPGVIPSHLENQQAALKLAICDDIGEAAYDTQRVAAAFIDLVLGLQAERGLEFYGQALCDRYSIPLQDLTGESFVAQLAETRFQEDKEKAARRILDDFRTGALGALPLEWPPA